MNKLPRAGGRAWPSSASRTTCSRGSASCTAAPARHKAALRDARTNRRNQENTTSTPSTQPRPHQ
jgi:hypothetical protein